MVVAQRMELLKQFATRGRQLCITYSWSEQSGRMKVKVRVGDRDGVVPCAFRGFLLDSLAPLSTMEHEVVIDRGHCFSSGRAVACFWVNKAPATKELEQAEANLQEQPQEQQQGTEDGATHIEIVERANAAAARLAESKVQMATEQEASRISSTALRS